ncbi:hypothetical protein [Bacillus safensis]|nr:hypothetical protein [Bacillus safensis]
MKRIHRIEKYVEVDYIGIPINVKIDDEISEEHAGNKELAYEDYK